MKMLADESAMQKDNAARLNALKSADKENSAIRPIAMLRQGRKEAQRLLALLPAVVIHPQAQAHAAGRQARAAGL